MMKRTTKLLFLLAFMFEYVFAVIDDLTLENFFVSDVKNLTYA